jgi:hypothetical protein
MEQVELVEPAAPLKPAKKKKQNEAMKEESKEPCLDWREFPYSVSIFRAFHKAAFLAIETYSA